MLGLLTLPVEAQQPPNPLTIRDRWIGTVVTSPEYLAAKAKLGLQSMTGWGILISLIAPTINQTSAWHHNALHHSSPALLSLATIGTMLVCHTSPFPITSTVAHLSLLLSRAAGIGLSSLLLL